MREIEGGPEDHYPDIVADLVKSLHPRPPAKAANPANPAKAPDPYERARAIARHCAAHGIDLADYLRDHPEEPPPDVAALLSDFHSRCQRAWQQARHMRLAALITEADDRIAELLAQVDFEALRRCIPDLQRQLDDCISAYNHRKQD